MSNWTEDVRVGVRPLVEIGGGDEGHGDLTVVIVEEIQDDGRV